MGLTLLSATDENLFRNSIVELPQINTGISLKQSFLFAPAIFFYLHAQSLFLMQVLKRKIARFEVALEHILSSAKIVDKAEYLDWLSAFSFVQLFRQDAKITHISRCFVWIGTNAVPLILLFLIDIAFLRYQSFEITLWHHFLFFADILVVSWFNRSVFLRRHRYKWKWLPLRQLRRATFKRDVILFALGPLDSLILIVNRGAAIIMMLVLIIYAQVPRYDSDAEVTSHRANALWGNIEKDLLQALWDKENILDVVLCPRWSWSCRRLNGENLELIEQGSAEDILDIAAEFQEDKNRVYQMRYGIDLSGRSLRYANLDNAWLPGAKLVEADLRGALLRSAQLHGANLIRAQVDGAYMYQTRLNRADLRETHLRKTVLKEAELNDVDFCEANLDEAYLDRAELDRTNFHRASLRKANLSVGSLKSANFHGADLGNSIVTIYEMECVNFHGANFANASVKMFSVEDSNFHVANLNEASEISFDSVKCSKFLGANVDVEQMTEEDECERECPTRRRKIPDCGEPGYIRTY